jgi:TonB family protein
MHKVGVRMVTNVDGKKSERSKSYDIFKSKLKPFNSSMAEGEDLQTLNEDSLSSEVDSEIIFNSEYLNNPQPVYPKSAREVGASGTVIVKVSIRSNGEVKTVELHRSSGYSILDKSATSAIEKWKFIPATKNGVNVESSVLIPINFKLL